ncbi:hypothetical protein IID04_01870 [PVC group bacterium]|nr:hypothetical protein [PVC group bacterium]MCH7590268.1 hypothetical protein [PVC group bacterium]
MPCSDVTEIIELTLDSDEMLQDFILTKKSCGKSVGGRELLPYIKGKPVQELMNAVVEDYVPDLDQLDPISEFLLCKHLYSIQVCLGVFLGMGRGKKSDVFAIENVKYETSGTTTIEGLINLALKTEEIKSCHGCKCSSKKAK